MKKLFLLLLMVGAGSTIQAQEDWRDQKKIFDDVYSLATDLNAQTDKVTAQGSVISIQTGKGTISVERELDKSKPKELQHFYYNLLTSNGKSIRLDKMNAERVIESFQSKLLKLKEELRVNQDADVENILKDLFN
ncbi:hypothetical protein [uncultured Aquimarina sp.]|uniref:hypothetical protein n=1 Tax=uncultured Aquimarina sp. TaxID=575652 RepID=UPI00262613DE|nr:hypothetical protein [uncultured Aquimarina sp.]